MKSAADLFGRVCERHRLTIVFVAGVLCVGGIFCAVGTPSAIFPRTDFPRVAIIISNGIMPADEMMATVTRPIEEAMKGVPGAVSVRSSTGRGSAEVNVFFGWKADMVTSELYVISKFGEIKSALPQAATAEISRVTFSAFPIVGLSLTSPSRDQTSLWEIAEYTVKPELLRIEGLSRVDIVGGNAPEFQVSADPARMAAAGLTIHDVADALVKNNAVSAAGMIEENYHLYLAAVDGRVSTADEIGDLVVASRDGHGIRIRDLGSVKKGPEPAYKVVTANGRQSVLLNLVSQPEGSTTAIAKAVRSRLGALKKQLPGDVEVGIYYDQSEFVRQSVDSVWAAMGFGLILSVVILFFFLRDWGTVATAILVIPITVLVTFIAIRLLGLAFNLMTLGGIAAGIGLVIDDAIVVTESVFSRLAAGRERADAVREGLAEIFRPLVASTLTPVVVFLPLAFLDGITGVFFRALACTMVVSLLTSLALALTVTPSLAALFLGAKSGGHASRAPQMRRALNVYGGAMRYAFANRGTVLVASLVVGLFGFLIYRQLKSDFLPPFDEGGFIIDFEAPFGTSLSESSRMLDQAEAIIKADPDVESYSRRLGAELGLFFTEPNRGDYAVKLKAKRTHSTAEVMAGFRHRFENQIPAVRWDFHGILSDLVGDLSLTPDPIEIKLFSPDLSRLRRLAPHVEESIKAVRGVVDTFDGFTETGPSIRIKIKQAEASRLGITTSDLAQALSDAELGEQASRVLEGDRSIAIRVWEDRASVSSIESLRNILVPTASGARVTVGQVATLEAIPSNVEIDRDDLRQDVTVTGRLEGRDLGSAMAEIRSKLAKDPELPPGSVEYGGLYSQQRQAFENLLAVLGAALLLVFVVLLFEFGSFLQPISIVFGSVLALTGTVAALWVTGIALNIVAFLGAIIGVGLVAKNGILMLERVDRLRSEGQVLEEAIIGAGDRRLRPVLMTTLAAAIGLLPLAAGRGTGAQMLQPLAVAVIGALVISVLLSLVATPTLYYVLCRGAVSPEKGAD
ncbi:MAG TPA: efflux RND transporter permease subunit [Opitutaceae bacterium]